MPPPAMRRHTQDTGALAGRRIRLHLQNVLGAAILVNGCQHGAPPDRGVGDEG